MARDQIQVVWQHSIRICEPSISAKAMHQLKFVYIFKEKQKQRYYIIQCESKACMAMKPNAWMTTFLFSTWIL